MSAKKLQELATKLNDCATENGLVCQSEMLAGEVDVLQVTVQDREELPIYVTIDDAQVLCITHLWHENEVKEGQREALLENMLMMNIPMPLSAFSKVGDQYLLFGALANGSSMEDVVFEIETLSENTLEAIAAFREYLN